MENIKSKSKRSSFFIIMLIILLIIALLGATYSLFMYAKRGIKDNTIKTSSINFSFDETTNGISLKNALPMKDEVGKKLQKYDNKSGYFDFTVSYDNTSSSARPVSYEIYITPSENNTLDGKYVKIYLTDENDLPLYDNGVKTFDQLEEAKTTDDNSKQLYYNSFTKSGKKKFRLRIWLSENYPIDNESKSFKLKVNVNAFEE